METSLFEKFKETANHGLVYGIGSSLKSVVGFILIPIYTTQFSISEFGALGLIRMAIQIISVICVLGIPSAMFRSYFDYSEDENSIVISTALLLMICSCAAVFSLSTLMSAHISTLLFGDDTYNIHILVGIGIAAINAILQIPFTYIRVEKKSKLYSISPLFIAVMAIFLSIVFIIVLNMGILGALLGTLVSNITTLVILIWLMRNEIKFAFSNNEAKKILKFAFPLLPAQLAAYSFNYSDRLLLNWYESLETVGLYVLGYQFGMLILILFSMPVTLVWGPMFLSVKEDTNVKKFCSKALTYSTIIGIELLLLVSLLSKEFIELASANEYHGAYEPVPVIALSYTIFGWFPIVNVGIIIKRRTIFTALNSILGAIINIALNILLIPTIGLMGAAYSTLITFIFMFIFLLMINRNLYMISYEWKRILMIYFLASIVFIIGYSIEFEQIFFSILFKIVIIIFLPLSLLPLHFFTSEEIDGITQMMGFILKKMNVG